MEDSDEAPPCRICGKPAAIIVDDIPWCEGHLHQIGSCCGEWQGDDTRKSPEKDL